MATSLNLTPVLDGIAESMRERGCDASVATMSLVVFVENPAIGELARERIHLLAAKHPSRVIVLDAGHSSNLQRVVSCDWIELGVKESGPEMLRSAVGALKLPDAPVVLLWIARGIGTDPRYAMLCDEAQTVVYNSSLLDVGTEGLAELVAYVAQSSNVVVADIAYLRLAPWQECVAIFFDGRSDELADLQRVEIACGSDPEAYYLLGWLASRLQWVPGGEAMLRSQSGKCVGFEIQRRGEPRRVSRVALHSSRSHFVAEVDPNEETILLSVTGSSEHGPRHRRINNPGIAGLVERAILWGENDRIFRAALASAGEILTRGESE
jgi:glucose-6-phosphate dehydrogenase assembly protein OpcA